MNITVYKSKCWPSKDSSELLSLYFLVSFSVDYLERLCACVRCNSSPYPLLCSQLSSEVLSQHARIVPLWDSVRNLYPIQFCSWHAGRRAHNFHTVNSCSTSPTWTVICCRTLLDYSLNVYRSCLCRYLLVSWVTKIVFVLQPKQIKWNSCES